MEPEAELKSVRETLALACSFRGLTLSITSRTFGARAEGAVPVAQPVAAPREQPAGFQQVQLDTCREGAVPVAQPVAAPREQPAGFKPAHVDYLVCKLVDESDLHCSDRSG